MTTTPPAPATGDGPAAPEPRASGTVDERLAAQDQKINAMDGKLDQVLNRLTGGGGDGGGAPAAPEPVNIGQLVRDGVREIEKEKDRKATADKRQADDQTWRASVETRLAERRPAAPATGAMTRVRTILFGKQDPT